MVNLFKKITLFLKRNKGDGMFISSDEIPISINSLIEVSADETDTLKMFKCFNSDIGKCDIIPENTIGYFYIDPVNLKVVGYVLIDTVNKGIINSIYINKKYRYKSLFEQFILKAVNTFNADTIKIDTRIKSNENIIMAYNACGFKLIDFVNHMVVLKYNVKEG